MDEHSNRLIYVYQSPFGLMSIRYVPGQTYPWHLMFEEYRTTKDGQIVASNALSELGWKSPEDVAQTVYTRTSGWRFWDTLPLVVFPASLDDWQAIDPGASQPEA